MLRTGVFEAASDAVHGGFRASQFVGNRCRCFTGGAQLPHLLFYLVALVARGWASGWSLVEFLLTRAGPLAVLRRVWPIVVDAINRATWRFCTHVGDEVPEALRPSPSVADGDTAAAIISAGIRAVTALHHPPVRGDKRMTCFASPPVRIVTAEHLPFVGCCSRCTSAVAVELSYRRPLHSERVSAPGACSRYHVWDRRCEPRRVKRYDPTQSPAARYTVAWRRRRRTNPLHVD